MSSQPPQLRHKRITSVRERFAIAHVHFLCHKGLGSSFMSLCCLMLKTGGGGAAHLALSKAQTHGSLKCTHGIIIQDLQFLSLAIPMHCVQIAK